MQLAHCLELDAHPIPEQQLLLRGQFLCILSMTLYAMEYISLASLGQLSWMCPLLASCEK